MSISMQYCLPAFIRIYISKFICIYNLKEKILSTVYIHMITIQYTIEAFVSELQRSKVMLSSRR